MKDWNINIYRGILTGYNEAFIIDGKKKEELIAQDPKSAEIIRPLLRGRDIKRYSYDFADLYLLFIPWHFPLHNDSSIVGASLEAEKEFENQYPAIYNHLLQYKTGLSNRNKAETGIRYEWYALQRWGANYWEDFFRPKIVWKRVGSILRFSYDESKALALDSTCFATGQKVKYLVAILNSKFGKYLMKNSPKTGTGDLLISVQAIEPLIIPIPDEEFLVLIEKTVDKIFFALENQNPITEFESEINFWIYTMLRFTKQEIEFIEYQ